MFQSLIVGFGKAGRDLHLRCLRKAQVKHRQEHLFDETVGIVDPRLSELNAGIDQRIPMFRSVDKVQGFDPASTVVHICTAPADHFTALRQVADQGYTKIVMEKPLTPYVGELADIQHLSEERDMEILIVANWLSSSLTARLRTLLSSNQFGKLLRIKSEQHKSRYFRTLNSPGHATAFDVEMPHQLVLALYLGGQDVYVNMAKSSAMQCGTTIIPYMGSAQLGLLHANGTSSFLFSDLTTHIRKRSVELHFENHRIIGYYPTDGEESYSRVTIYDCDDRMLETELLEDDPLTTCFVEFYRYYSGRASKPISDLRFNMAAISVLARAKALCGITVPERKERTLTLIGADASSNL
jgi:predicted dehydrogenase